MSEEYKRFSGKFNFKRTFSTPQDPKSNGQAERYAQTILKNIIKKVTLADGDINLALLAY